MYDLFLFYYTCWLLTIIIYFFMEKSTLRNFYMIWLLMIITASPYLISFASVQISMAYVVLLIGTLFLFGLKSLQLYEYIVAFICMVGYAAILIWEIIAPVWFFMPRTVILALLIVSTLLLCIRVPNRRMIVSVIGLTFGQLLYELILMVYHLHDVIGALQEMTILSVTLLLLLGIDLLHQTKTMIVSRIKSFS